MDVGSDQKFINPAQEYLRLGPTVYYVLLFGFMSIAIISAAARTGFRIRKFRTIELDDIFLVVSVVFLAGGTFIAWYTRDLAYLQMSVSLGLISRPPDDFSLRMMTFQILNDVGGVLTWVSIFTVKLAFLLFFKKLVRNVRYIGPYWWVCLAIVVAGAATNIAMGFYICPHFGPDAVQLCTIQGLNSRETIYLNVSTATDIVTDLLIISIPIALLWKVKINLRRKMALGALFSLSAVMIALALMRALLAPVKPLKADLPSVTDTLWLFAFHNVEASVAIVMVSITAFRSMLGQAGYTRKASAASDMEAVRFAAQPALVMSYAAAGRSFGSVSDANASALERERNNSVWSMPAFEPKVSMWDISQPVPTPPPKDPYGPLPPRRQMGSFNEEFGQVPPPRSTFEHI